MNLDFCKVLLRESVRSGEVFFLKKNHLKTMTCNQLGGACDKKCQAESFEEIAALSKQHGMEMFQTGDEAHLKVMDEMKKLMQDPDSLGKWIDDHCWLSMEVNRKCLMQGKY